MAGFIGNTGPISFDNDIEEVFEDQTTPAMSLSEYYRNGTNIQTAITAGNVDTSTIVTSGIPTSGQISFSDFRNQGFATVPQGAIYDRNNTTPGTNVTFTVPANIYEISAFVIGAGGGGGGNDNSSWGAGGGGGGGSCWATWTTTPGTVYTIQIGAGGTSGSGSGGTNGGDGGDSSIKVGSTTYIRADGGGGGLTGSNMVGSNTSYGTGGGARGYGFLHPTLLNIDAKRAYGGYGGDARYSASAAANAGGGGGAGGYGSLGQFGKGGDGEDADGTGIVHGNSGSGGGGERVLVNTFPQASASGGAVGMYGEGLDGKHNGSVAPRVFNSRHGSTFTYGIPTRFLVPASGAGSVTAPVAGTFNNPTTTGSAASPGGGGAGCGKNPGFGQKGGDGGIRIVWGFQPDGTTPRRYPAYSHVIDTPFS